MLGDGEKMINYFATCAVGKFHESYSELFWRNRHL